MHDAVDRRTQIESINTEPLSHNPITLLHAHPTPQTGGLVGAGRRDGGEPARERAQGHQIQGMHWHTYVSMSDQEVEWLILHQSSTLYLSLTKCHNSNELRQGLLEESRKASAEEDEEEAERQMERGADPSVAMVAGAGDEAGGKGKGKGGWRKYVMFWRKG